MGLKELRSSIPLIKILDLYQRIRPEESCDTHVYCQDGYIPCHRFVLMANSAFLNQLIMDNLNEIGHKDTTAVISLTLPDFKTRHVAHVISMFYTGKVVCSIKDVYYVQQLLKILGIGDVPRTVATEAEITKCYKPRYIIDSLSDSDEEVDDCKFTTNVFTASKKLKVATRGKNKQNKTNGNSRKDSNTTVPSFIKESPPNGDATDPVSSTSDCSFNVKPQRSTSIVTPKNIPALRKRRTRIKTRKSKEEESVVDDIDKKRRKQAKERKLTFRTIYQTRSKKVVFVPSDTANAPHDHASETSGEYSQSMSSNSVQPYVFQQPDSPEFPFGPAFVAGKYFWEEKYTRDQKKNNLTDLNNMNKPSTFTAAMSQMAINNLDCSSSKPNNFLVPQIPELGNDSSNVLNGNKNGLSQIITKYVPCASGSTIGESLYCGIETFENQGCVTE